MNDITPGELEAAWAEELPARREMALLNLNLAVPVNVALAANVLTVGSEATALAYQLSGVSQR